MLQAKRMRKNSARYKTKLKKAYKRKQIHNKKLLIQEISAAISEAVRCGKYETSIGISNSAIYIWKDEIISYFAAKEFNIAIYNLEYGYSAFVEVSWD